MSLRMPSTDLTELEQSLDYWRQQHSRQNYNCMTHAEDEPHSTVRYNDTGSLEEVGIIEQNLKKKWTPPESKLYYDSFPLFIVNPWNSTAFRNLVFYFISYTVPIWTAFSQIVKAVFRHLNPSTDSLSTYFPFLRKVEDLWDHHSVPMFALSHCLKELTDHHEIRSKLYATGGQSLFFF